MTNYKKCVTQIWVFASIDKNKRNTDNIGNTDALAVDLYIFIFRMQSS